MYILKDVCERNAQKNVSDFTETMLTVGWRNCVTWSFKICNAHIIIIVIIMFITAAIKTRG